MENQYPLFYHIGLPKTGTTTIQYVLRNDSRVHLIGNRYFNRFEYWKRPYSDFRYDRVNIVSEENQITQIEDFGKMSLLLSRIRDCAPGAHVIVTIREQRDLLESRYKFNFPWHGGYHESFQTWIESGQGMDYLSICMYASIYDTLCAFFPRDQIHFLMFEDLKFNYQDFFRAFYSIMNLKPPEVLDREPIVINKALSESELRILKRLNHFKLFRGNSAAALYELRLFTRIAEWFRKDGERCDEFRWSAIKFRNNIEEDFARENAGLVRRNIFTADKLKSYHYLVDPLS